MLNPVRGKLRKSPCTADFQPVFSNAPNKRRVNASGTRHQRPYAGQLASVQISGRMGENDNSRGDLDKRQSSIADLAHARPPRGFHDFKLEFVESKHETGFEFISFDLSCPGCFGILFDALLISAAMGPAGINARCRGCGRGAQVFHAAVNGYDGEFGHLQFMKDVANTAPLTGAGGRPLGPVRLRVSCSYSISPSELIESAAELGVAPQDLFDWFHLLTKSSEADDWDWTWDWECA